VALGFVTVDTVSNHTQLACASVPLCNVYCVTRVHFHTALAGRIAKLLHTNNELM
jgi:putative component of membrane protein insertase Oxa1/YidC/SpoIIIJ protein YidD